jgi:hypothetical protein
MRVVGKSGHFLTQKELKDAGAHLTFSHFNEITLQDFIDISNDS